MAIISLTFLVIFWALGSFISYVLVYSSIALSDSYCSVLILVSLGTLSVASLLAFLSRYCLCISMCFIDRCWIKFVVVQDFVDELALGTFVLHLLQIVYLLPSALQKNSHITDRFFDFLCVTRNCQINSHAYVGMHLYWFINPITMPIQ